MTEGERRILDAIRQDHLEVDGQGRVWLLAHRSGVKGGGHKLVRVRRRRVEHQAKPQSYLQVRLMVDGRRYHASAHRIVWAVFNGWDIPDEMDINHINGIKDDNRPSNLELTTPSQNMQHAHRTGLRDQHGQRNPAARLTDNQVAQIRLAYSHDHFTQAQLAEKYGVSFQHVSKLIRGQRRQKQTGPVDDREHRHIASERDPISGRFAPTAAGRLLDGRTWDEYPMGVL